VTDYSGVIPFIERLCAIVKPESYLQLGLRSPEGFAASNCKTVIVDPDAGNAVPVCEGRRIFRTETQQFFEREAPSVLAKAPDLVLLDSRKPFNAIFDDFCELLPFILPTTIVVIDDILPGTEGRMDVPMRELHHDTSSWCFMRALHHYIPGAFLVPVDATAGGVLLICGTLPGSDHDRLLLGKSEQFPERFSNPDHPMHPDYYESLHPGSDDALKDLLHSVVKARPGWRATMPDRSTAIQKFWS